MVYISFCRRRRTTFATISSWWEESSACLFVARGNIHFQSCRPLFAYYLRTVPHNHNQSNLDPIQWPVYSRKCGITLAKIPRAFMDAAVSTPDIGRHINGHCNTLTKVILPASPLATTVYQKLSKVFFSLSRLEIPLKRQTNAKSLRIHDYQKHGHYTANVRWRMVEWR